jgi:Ca2+-binding RTX toxin-like protein
MATMARIIQNRLQTAGDVVAGVEGTAAVWDTHNLTYSFATNADAALASAEVFSPQSPYTGTFNALDTEVNYRNVILRALTAYSQVANITFTTSPDFASADIKLLGIDNLKSDVSSDFVLTGVGDFPGTNFKGTFDDFESYLRLSTTTPYASLARETGAANALDSSAIHELGHVLGLAHPHDNGNFSRMVSFLGFNVTPETPLDNERYTAMSYERGGLNVQLEGTFGHLLTPSPIDIAALQAIYGTTINNNTDTLYVLSDRDTGALDVDGSDGIIQIGRAFYSIWDTGGTDKIYYNGAKRVVLNLNDASLTLSDDIDTLLWIEDVKSAKNYGSLPTELKLDLQDASYHSGGFFSRITNNAGLIGGIQNIFSAEIDLGGYSIAKGAKIENASGGSGDDFLIGNELDNVLDGNNGDDFIHGVTGNDSILGGNGDDEIVGGGGNDTIDGGNDKDVAIYSDKCTDYDIIRDEATGLITINHIRGTKTDGIDVIKNVEQARFTDALIDLTQPGKILGCPPIDFIFLVDLSSSYADDLPNFVSSSRNIVNSVRSLDPNAQFALASFIDKQAPGVSVNDYLYKPELALTTSTTSFENALSALKLGVGGYDIPEAQYVGLWRAANGVGLNLRANSRKVILIATDSPPKSAADFGLDETNIRQFLAREGIYVSALSATASAPNDPSGDFLGKLRTAADTDNGLTPTLEAVDPLASEVNKFFDKNSVTPIFAVTSDVKSNYQDIQKFLGRGTVVTVDSAGVNITDAVRQALAQVTGTVTNGGTDGNDTLIGTDPVKDVFFGGLGKDRLEGRANDDTLDGGADDDTVLGEAGNDLIRGGTGADSLDGGTGDDTIEPGAGIDIITLGAGKDVLQGTAAELVGDSLRDFAIEDQIVVLGKSYSQIQITATADGNSLISADSNPLLTITGKVNTLFSSVTGSGDTASTTISLVKLNSLNWNPATSIFATGAAKSQLRLKFDTQLNTSAPPSEIGLFKVDDVAGNIAGISPGTANYLQAALARAQGGFSALRELPQGFVTDAAKNINLDENSFYQFYTVVNATTDSVLSGKTPLTAINLASPTTTEVTNVNTDIYKLAWKDGGNSFANLVVNAELTPPLLSTGANLQGKNQSEVLDFRNFVGKKINSEFTINRKAVFQNHVGFYEITDEQGTVFDTATGKSLAVGSVGYVDAAIRNRIAGVDLQVNNDGKAVLNGTFDGGKLFAPFLVINSSIDPLLDTVKTNDPTVYFAFLGANSDKTDHVRLLGDNLFGFEDLPNGGDFDYNDLTVKMSFNVV